MPIIMKSSVDRDNNYCHYVGFAITLQYHPAGSVVSYYYLCMVLGHSLAILGRRRLYSQWGLRSSSLGVFSIWCEDG
jgi:hypothetical protein